LPILPLWLNLLLEVMALSLLTLDLVLFNASQGSNQGPHLLSVPWQQAAANHRIAPHGGQH
jgi:hypothetical protein